MDYVKVKSEKYNYEIEVEKSCYNKVRETIAQKLRQVIERVYGGIFRNVSFDAIEQTDDYKKAVDQVEEMFYYNYQCKLIGDLEEAMKNIVIDR